MEIEPKKIHTDINWKKYVYSFIITAVIFATAISLSNYFNNKKIDDIRNIQDKISIDILSSETQFSLLEQSSCSDIGGSSALSQELGSLEDKLAITEKDRGVNDAEVITLKKYYALLEIKDYILMKKISQQCKTAPVSIIYFYSNKGDCADCEREGYVLTFLRQEYPTLRVYSFDYNSDLSAVKTLFSINNMHDQLPALYIDGKAYYGFQSVDDLESLPDIKTLHDEMASSTRAQAKAKTATSTER